MSKYFVRENKTAEPVLNIGTGSAVFIRLLAVVDRCTFLFMKMLPDAANYESNDYLPGFQLNRLFPFALNGKGSPEEGR
jgi:hypothetical protein